MDGSPACIGGTSIVHFHDGRIWNDLRDQNLEIENDRKSDCNLVDESVIRVRISTFSIDLASNRALLIPNLAGNHRLHFVAPDKTTTH